jgi:hypothetical protein
MRETNTQELISMMNALLRAHGALTTAVEVLLNAGSFPPEAVQKVRSLLGQARPVIQGLDSPIFLP